MSNPLTHFNGQGRARMVDVSEKDVTQRIATAQGKVLMQPATLQLIREGKTKKGDVLAVAQVAGVMAAKKTFEIIPMCHSLPLSNVDINFSENDEENNGLCSIGITAVVKVTGRTGVEMEALTAVCVTALTIYDMCKAVDRGMVLKNIELIHKSGGRSGTFEKRQSHDHG